VYKYNFNTAITPDRQEAQGPTDFWACTSIFTVLEIFKAFASVLGRSSRRRLGPVRSIYCYSCGPGCI